MINIGIDVVNICKSKGSVIDLPFSPDGKKKREIYHGSDKLPFVIHDEIRYGVSDAYI